MGDLFEGSLQPPGADRIPFVGFLLNEPTFPQELEENCELVNIGPSLGGGVATTDLYSSLLNAAQYCCLPPIIAAYCCLLLLTHDRTELRRTCDSSCSIFMPATDVGS
jgi:hypothetical protein